MRKLVIENATVITMNAQREIIRGDILIEGSRIKKIGKLKKVEFENARRINASGLVATPGFIQTHIHLCQTLFRNLADDLELLDWLKLKIWPFEAAHTPQTIALSAQMGLAELIQCGTTTIMDMGTVHHTDYVFEQIERSGMRALAGKAMMDDTPGAPKGLKESRSWSIDESLRLQKYWHDRSGGRIKFAFAPRFVLSCSEPLLEEVRDLAQEKQLIVHTHAAENRSEMEAVHRRCGAGNIEYFHRIRLTGERLCLAHCIWLNDHEMEIVRDTQTKVLHCPSSNLKLGSGIAKIPELLAMGVPVSLGADGAPCNNNLDIFQEMRLAALIQKPRLGPRSLTAEKVFEMATLNGAKTLGLQDELGSIEAGKKADIALIDLQHIHSQPSENLYAQIVYSGKSTDVQTVIIDGKIVMKNRRLQTLDSENIHKTIKTSLKKILTRI